MNRTDMEKIAFLNSIKTLGNAAYRGATTMYHAKGAPGTTFGQRFKNTAAQGAQAFRNAGGSQAASNLGTMANNNKGVIAGGAGLAGAGYLAGKYNNQPTRGRRKYASIADGVDILDFLSIEEVSKIQNAGMHKVAAVMENIERGTNIDEIDLASAAGLIGQRSFIKNAQERTIKSGLQAYNMLKG